MRFNPATILLAAMVGTAFAGQSHIEARVPQTNDPLSFLSGLSHAPITDLLNQALGPSLRKIEDALSFTPTQKLTESIQWGAPLSVVVAIVEAVGELLGGADIGVVDQNLFTNSNGYFDSLDSALGVTKIGEAAKDI